MVAEGDSETGGAIAVGVSLGAASVPGSEAVGIAVDGGVGLKTRAATAGIVAGNHEGRAVTIGGSSGPMQPAHSTTVSKDRLMFL